MGVDEFRRAVILVVEDDDADQELVSRALDNETFRTELRMVSDGVEALSYLRHEGAYADPESSPTPDLILLDLNMPRMDGRELLEKIRLDEALKHLAVVVTTTSEHESDMLRAREWNCQAYVSKPVELEIVVRALREGVGSYWFQLVTLVPDS